MKKNKWLLILSLVLAMSMTLGSTMAYLTDTDTKTNTFTMGKVDISVEEENVGDKLTPGQETNKDAKITNNGDNDAWVWMTVVVPGNIAKYVTPVWANGVTPDYTTTDATTGDMTYTVLVDTALASKASTGKILDAVKMDGSVDIQNDKLVAVVNGVPTEITGDLKVIVNGYAVQKDGFDTVTAAYNAYNAQWGITGGGSSGEDEQPGEDDEPTNPDEGDDEPIVPEGTQVANQTALEQAINQGGTIVLTENITTTATIVIPANTTVVLNLNGKTLHCEALPVLRNQGTLTVTGGTITSARSNAVENWSTGNLTVNDATLSSVQNTGIATLNNVTLQSKGTFALYSYNKGVMTINSGYYTGGFWNSESNKIIIKGGTFSADPTQYVDTENYTVTTNTDDTYTVTAK